LLTATGNGIIRKSGRKIIVCTVVSRRIFEGLCCAIGVVTGVVAEGLNEPIICWAIGRYTEYWPGSVIYFTTYAMYVDPSGVMAGLQIWTIKHDYVYSITYLANPRQYNIYLQYANNIIHSMKIIPSNTS
jgi:hypothetical protein